MPTGMFLRFFSSATSRVLPGMQAGVFLDSSMGIELELLVLLAFSIVGQSTFAAFAVETPAWQKILKWLVIVAATLGLHSLVGHWAVLLPLLAGALASRFTLSGVTN